MHRVDVEVLRIQLHQVRRILQNEQVLSVPLLCCFGKVERTSNDGSVVDDHNFVVGDHR